MYVVKTLKEFQYVDEDGKDQGANVRQKAKDITNLLQDESRLRQERRARAHMRDRMIRGTSDDPGEFEDENRSRRLDSGSNPPTNGLAGKRPNRDEEELRKAIEESKKSLAQERVTAEQRDLERAIRMSQEEEDQRKKQVADSASSLFDDTNQTYAFLFASVKNNPHTIRPSPSLLLDPTPYAIGLQPQYTSMPQVQQQFTSFNPYQQQAQEAAQAEFLQQQQQFLLQQQQAQQQQQQQEEYMRQQQLLQFQQQQHQQQTLFAAQQQQNLFAPQQSLQAQPTGFGYVLFLVHLLFLYFIYLLDRTNNPFAPSSSPSIPLSNQTQQRKPSPTFNLQSTYEIHSPSQLSSLSSSPAPSSHTPSNQQGNQGQRPIAVKKKEDENESLAALFADREGGQDTFGNIGALRFVIHSKLPWSKYPFFVYRYGYTDVGRSILANKTGSSHNPFAQQQQSNEKPFFDI
jgi:epsin